MHNTTLVGSGDPTVVEKLAETVNGRDIPIGTLEEFAIANNVQIERREDGPSTKLGVHTLKEPAPHLAIEKYKTSAGKSYRLIWVWRRYAWLAAEDLTPYRTRYAAVAAGIDLAARKGARFEEAGR